jgi:hypothetical protein
VEEVELKALVLVCGDTVGVSLFPRSSNENDWHVLFAPFKTTPQNGIADLGFSGSSYWMLELQECMRVAEDWLNDNARLDIGPDGRIWGWVFLEKTVRLKTPILVNVPPRYATKNQLENKIDHPY